MTDKGSIEIKFEGDDYDDTSCHLYIKYRGEIDLNFSWSLDKKIQNKEFWLAFIEGRDPTGESKSNLIYPYYGLNGIYEIYFDHKYRNEMVIKVNGDGFREDRMDLYLSFLGNEMKELFLKAIDEYF
jgi:hypothetical protein